MRVMDPATLARLALLSAILAISTPDGAPAITAQGTQAAAVPSGSTTHVVQAGDTLYSIALQFNTTILAIQQANNLADPNALSIGQRLIVPGVPLAQLTGTPASPVTPGPDQTPLPNTTPTLIAAALPPDVETYIVQSGDTLAAIAAQFGVTVAELQRINDISNPNLLSVGQRLIIPNSSSNPGLPDGISISPQVVRQGNTVVIRVTTPGTSQVLGKFDSQDLRFNPLGDAWVALVGISRCSNYIGDYPVSLTVHDTLGNPTRHDFNLRVNAGTFPTLDLTLTAEMSALLDPAIMNAENARVTQTVAPYTPGQAWTGSFRSPLDLANPRVSSQFGERRSYNGGQPGLCGHEGQDYGVPADTPVYAPADGTVVMATPLKVRGSVVFIDHGRGVYSGFYHLNELGTTQGQRVKAGDLIGKVGTTGFSTGAHLHWSLWVNGIYVDPIQWTQETIP
jgi:murein DD-endopeptidase MepM/ murein hydrolase activator NlpD